MPSKFRCIWAKSNISCCPNNMSKFRRKNLKTCLTKCSFCSTCYNSLIYLSFWILHYNIDEALDPLLTSWKNKCLDWSFININNTFPCPWMWCTIASVVSHWWMVVFIVIWSLVVFIFKDSKIPDGTHLSPYFPSWKNPSNLGCGHVYRTKKCLNTLLSNMF